MEEAKEAWSKYVGEQKEKVSQELKGDATFQKWKEEQIARHKADAALRQATLHEGNVTGQTAHGQECFCPKCDQYGF